MDLYKMCFLGYLLHYFFRHSGPHFASGIFKSSSCQEFFLSIIDNTISFLYSNLGQIIIMDAFCTHSIIIYEARILRINLLKFRILDLFQILCNFKEIYWTFHTKYIRFILPFRYIIENYQLCVTVSADLSTMLYSYLLPSFKFKVVIFWTLIVRSTFFCSRLLLSYALTYVLYWTLVVSFLCTTTV